jgi:hypothetical protein
LDQAPGGGAIERMAKWLAAERTEVDMLPLDGE